MLFVWLMVFVIIGSAEAAHLCGPIIVHSWHHGNASVEQGFPGEGEVCLVCVASQSATQSIASTQWAPVFVVAATLPISEFSAPGNETEAALYSRPPPVQ